MASPSKPPRSSPSQPPGSKTRSGRKTDKDPTLIEERRSSRSDEVTEDGLAHDEAEELEEGEDNSGEHEYPIPAGWSLEDLTNEEFWIKVYELEQAQEESLAAFRKVLAAHGFLSEGHFSWVRERFVERHGPDTNFAQAMMDARKAHDRQKARKAVGLGLLEPIEDVTLEVYATIQARRRLLPAGDAVAFEELLDEYSLSPKRFARIHEGWVARMNDPVNAIASASVSAEYRKHFEAALRPRRK